MKNFLQQLPLRTEYIVCPQCTANDRIGIHSHDERRYICHHCDKTFAETVGTPFYRLKYPLAIVVLVLTLLAHGCPIPAIVAAFEIDERTIADWHKKAGKHSQRVQSNLVCNGQVELGQVQMDELCINAQGYKVWVATGMTVFSRLFIWGEVSLQRNKSLIERVVQKVHAAASGVQPVVFAVDGFAAYPNAIRKFFHTQLRTGQVGRPRHIPWPDLHIVQVVKQHSGYHLTGIQRRIAHGCRQRADELIAAAQVSIGLINTAYIERLNATFRARMPALVRRTRCPARTTQRLTTELFWTGVVYNFCTVHSSLDATPTMAAGLTDHVWSVEELLRFYGPVKRLHGFL